MIYAAANTRESSGMQWNTHLRKNSKGKSKSKNEITIRGDISILKLLV